MLRLGRQTRPCLRAGLRHYPIDKIDSTAQEITSTKTNIRVVQEVDFEGRAKGPKLLKDDTLAACLDTGSSLQHHLVDTGLEGAGPHLEYLGATVFFSIGPKHIVEKVAGPMEVGAE